MSGTGTDEPDARAREIVAGLSMREKIGLMSGSSRVPGLAVDFLLFRRYNRRPYPAGGIPRYGVPPVLFSDGPRGVVSGHATCFPVAMARGASWDPQLEERIGEAIGREMRATGANYFGGVCVNLLRHPAWGRAQETYGEDSHLLGEMGAALVRGVQRHNVMACVKHYALNSMENARFTVDVRVDERTLREVYLPHFKRCVDEGAASVMGAYNKVRGDHACESEYLLRSILKEEWGFDGFVMSDFVFGVYDTVKAVRAGLDQEMPFVLKYGRKLERAVHSGQVDESIVDDAAERIVQTVLRFSTAKGKDARSAHDVAGDYGREVIACPEHRTLAREAAEKSMVLLKNDGGVLPLGAATLGRIAVVGRLAASSNLGDHGSSRVYPPVVVPPLAGIRERARDEVVVNHVRGRNPRRAARAAAKADVAIVFAGCDHHDEGEHLSKYHRAGDRDSLHLRAGDVAMIRAVAAANPRTIVVLMGGSAIMTEEWQDDAAAILMAWYPGMEGGRAIARVLFGDVNPGGKLPFIVPSEETDLPFFDKNATEIEYGYYHGYTLLDRKGKAPAWAFGFGLSYTTFELSAVSAKLESAADGAKQITLSVSVANTGSVPGDEVIQVYASFPESAHEMPVKKLVGFRRVSVDPGATDEVQIEIPADRLRWYDTDRRQWLLEPGRYRFLVGTSSRKVDLTTVELPL